MQSVDKILTSADDQKLVPAIRRDFANLLRQVQSLTDSIKLYNEELVANSDVCE